MSEKNPAINAPTATAPVRIRAESPNISPGVNLLTSATPMSKGNGRKPRAYMIPSGAAGGTEVTPIQN